MKPISDIRLFLCCKGESASSGMPENRGHSIILRRVAMKLRENGFSLGDFDHLYLRFTDALPEGDVQPVAAVDAYHPWYRYVDIGVHEPQELAGDNRLEFILNAAEQALHLYAGEDSQELIRGAIDEAVSQGPQMRMRLREKRHPRGSAVVWLRLRDDSWYSPLLCVYDAQGNERLCEELAPTMDLASIGEITLSGKRVTVKPRRSSYAQAQGLSPVSFEVTL